jgi:hypothetical protein
LRYSLIVGFDIPTLIVCEGDISDIFPVALIKSGPTLSPRSVETLHTRNFSHRRRTQCRKVRQKTRKDKNAETFHAHFLHEYMKRWEDYEDAIADYDIVPDDANAPDGRED